MKTSWAYSVRTEAERIVLTAHQISLGFYKTNNFIVLPTTSNSNSSNIVVFPNLKYRSIPRFWEQTKKVDISHRLVADNKRLVQAVLNQIEKLSIDIPKIEQT